MAVVAGTALIAGSDAPLADSVRSTVWDTAQELFGDDTGADPVADAGAPTVGLVRFIGIAATEKVAPGSVPADKPAVSFVKQ